MYSISPWAGFSFWFAQSIFICCRSSCSIPSLSPKLCHLLSGRWSSLRKTSLRMIGSSLCKKSLILILSTNENIFASQLSVLLPCKKPWFFVVVFVNEGHPVRWGKYGAKLMENSWMRTGKEKKVNKLMVAQLFCLFYFLQTSPLRFCYCTKKLTLSLFIMRNWKEGYHWWNVLKGFCQWLSSNIYITNAVTWEIKSCLFFVRLLLIRNLWFFSE